MSHAGFPWLSHKGYEGEPSRTKDGFFYEIINDGDVWMDMLQKINLMSHTYHEKNADLACELIVNTYFDELFIVYQTLQKEL